MNARGFTILELMAVIALLGILATFAIPAFNGYTERARTSQAIGAIGAISVEVHSWRVNNNGAFPATLAAAGITLDPDPWGNAYVYSNAPARVDGGGNVLNADFDLFSRGPDGGTAASITSAASLDDIIVARDGAFVGIAEDY
jgi:general secretion pathway protein G